MMSFRLNLVGWLKLEYLSFMVKSVAIYNTNKKGGSGNYEQSILLERKGRNQTKHQRFHHQGHCPCIQTRPRMQFCLVISHYFHPSFCSVFKTY
jgi:hypothetical protein